MTSQKVAEQKVYHLHSLGADEQLAVLWYVYKDFVKDNITPEPERPDENLDKSNELIEKVKQMSPEDQLQVQKDLIIGKDGEELQIYKEYSSNQKLSFWYGLAVEMEQGNAVQVPDDYQLSPDAQQLLDSVKTIGFSQQLVFIKDAVGLGAAQATEDNV
ncbi:MAG: orange carotenoid protein N-terminal domain-containing protein [Cyanobacteria bacterium J06607_15]